VNYRRHYVISRLHLMLTCVATVQQYQHVWRRYSSTNMRGDGTTVPTCVATVQQYQHDDITEHERQRTALKFIMFRAYIWKGWPTCCCISANF